MITLREELHTGWVWVRRLWAIALLFIWIPRGRYVPEVYSVEGIPVVAGQLHFSNLVQFTGSTAWILYGLLLLSALLVLSGRAVRAGLVLGLLTHCSLNLVEGMNYKGYDRLMVWQGLLLLVAPGAGRQPLRGSPFARMAMVVLFCGLYGSTGWTKILQEPLWWEGVPLAYDMVHLQFGGFPLGVWASDKTWLMLPMSWFTLFFEAGFPFLIWWGRARLWLLVGGVLFHLGILVMMNVASFSVASIVAYPVLMTAAEWERVKQFWTSRWEQRRTRAPLPGG